MFLAPWLETRRRSRSVRAAVASSAPAAAPVPGAQGLPAPPAEGYEALFAAEQRRAFRIAVLMTGRADRATAIVEEAFSRAAQQWTRLPADARVWFVQSTVVELCMGSTFVRSLLRPIGEVRRVVTETDDLERAAATLAVLEPTRRAIAILAHAEQMSVAEIAAVTGLEVDRVAGELDAALRELGDVFGTVAA